MMQFVVEGLKTIFPTKGAVMGVIVGVVLIYFVNEFTKAHEKYKGTLDKLYKSKQGEIENGL